MPAPIIGNITAAGVIIVTGVRRVKLLAVNEGGQGGRLSGDASRRVAQPVAPLLLILLLLEVQLQVLLLQVLLELQVLLMVLWDLVRIPAGSCQQIQ